MRRQRGMAMLAVVILIVVALAGLLIHDALRDNPRMASQTRAAPQLAEAREALIGHAKAEWCRLQTGTVADHLPCPDTGTSEGQAAATCAGTVRGRLPWRTLGLPPVRDAAGECLWYERGPGGARVIAPGAAQGAQVRDAAAGAPVCGGNYDPAQYVEGGNDIVLAIAAADLAPPSGCAPPAPPPPPPPPSSNPSCVSAANTLLSKVSGNSNLCRQGGNRVAPECTGAANQIAINNCGCRPAADAFVNPPCLNNVNPPQCQAAIASLQSCG